MEKLLEPIKFIAYLFAQPLAVGDNSVFTTSPCFCQLLSVSETDDKDTMCELERQI